MDVFIVIALLIIIIALFSFSNTISDKVSDLTKKVDFLQRQVHQMAQLINEKKIEPKSSPVAEQPKPVTEAKPEEEIKPVILAEIKTPPVVAEKPVVKNEPAEEKDILEEHLKLGGIKVVHETVAKEPEIKLKNTKAPSPGFFERNPDLEKFIGENLINKIGIAILVLGIAFFVKYAISQNWINEIGRTAIGILCGGILIGIAHKLRKTFAAFSSVLVGGGLAILYFTITIAFHEYHIFSQIAAFGIMTFITAFSVLLSISYDRKELAVLALIGGFTSPFLISTGSGSYISLFMYVTILNTGILALAYFKKWNILNILSYLFTTLLYTGWLFTKVIWSLDPPYKGAFIFATIFFTLFFLMNIINNVKESRKFNALEISLLLSNTFLYYSVGMYILNKVSGGEFKGLFTLFIALFNFAFAFLLYKKEKVDKNLVYLLIGLVLSFISLAIPVQFKGNHITLFWAAEAVLLVWLSQKSGIQLMKKASVFVMCLMISSLILDWQKIYINSYSTDVLPILLNKGFITGIAFILSTFLTIFFLKKEEDKYVFKGVETTFYTGVLNIILVLGIYAVGLLELRYQLYHHVAYYATRDLVIGCYNFLFLIALNLMAKRKKEIPFFLEISVVLGLLAVLFYPAFYHNIAVHVRNAYLNHHVSHSSFIFHYVDVILVIILLVICYKNMKKETFKLKELDYFIMWFISGAVVFIGSAELDHIVVLGHFDPETSIHSILQQSHKIGFPIFWGICSFILMFIGMKWKRRDLRIISLTLFLIIILKLFLFDIRGISEGGKIAAFIFLGVILLIVSFMYQKLKKLVLDVDTKVKTEEGNENK